jgi:hypothetical protein
LKSSEVKALLSNKSTFFKVLGVLVIRINDIVAQPAKRQTAQVNDARTTVNHVAKAKIHSTLPNNLEKNSGEISHPSSAKDEPSNPGTAKLTLLERHTLLMSKMELIEAENTQILLKNKALNEKLSSLQSLFDESIASSKVSKTISEKGSTAGFKAFQSRKATLQQCQITQLKRHLASFSDETERTDMIVSTSVYQISQIKTSLKEICSKHAAIKKDDVTSKEIESVIKKLDSVSRNIERSIRDNTKVKEERITPEIEFLTEFIHPSRQRDLNPVILSDVMDGTNH